MSRDVQIGFCELCGDYCAIRDCQCAECRHGVEKTAMTLWCANCEEFNVVDPLTHLCEECK